MNDQTLGTTHSSTGQMPMADIPTQHPKSFVYSTEHAPEITKKKVELLPLYNDQNPLLLKRVPEVDFTNPPKDLQELAERLVATMNNYGGAGLAANQCGVMCRMFVMSGGIVVINPVILEISQETAQEREGCLTFPGLTLPVLRAKSVKVSFCGLNGEKQEVTYTGITARVFQHEYDHLEGKVFTSKVGSLTLQMAKKKKAKLFKKMQRIVEYKQRMNG